MPRASATSVTSRLRVTLHHNLFEAIGQRAPRVRFGQVHVFNNLYMIRNVDNYQYSWGVGVQSRTYAENNFIELSWPLTVDQFIERLNGSLLRESGTLLNGRSHRHEVDLVAEYNAVNDPDLTEDVGWTPTLFIEIDPTKKVPNIVRKGAGPFGW